MTIVVTGATGNVGRPLVRELVGRGVAVTAVARTAAAGRGTVRQVSADLTDPAALAPVLDGAQALFVLTPAGVLSAGTGIGDLVAAAREARVRRLVLLSSQGVGTGRHPAVLEDAVRGSGLEWTILRPGGFASNAVQWAGSVRAERLVRAPFAEVALPVIDPADIAAVASAALRETGHHGQTYTLTGSAAVTPREQAAALGEVLGEPVRFTELSRGQARAELLRTMPEPVADGTLAILGEPAPAETEVHPDLRRVLGRPAATFVDWARRHRSLFA